MRCAGKMAAEAEMSKTEEEQGSVMLLNMTGGAALDIVYSMTSADPDGIEDAGVIYPTIKWR